VFPTTRTSAILDLLSGDPERQQRSVEVIAAAYWKPFCAYVQTRWRATPAHAEDLAQSFFEIALRRDLLASFEPGRARFRTFLRACLDRHVIDMRRRDTAQRRGGGAAESGVEIEDVPGTDRDPEELFEAEWLRHLMQLAITRLDAALTSAGKPVHAALFREFHVGDPPTYADAAARHGISVTDVTNWLHVARKEFRSLALELLRELTVDDEEFAAEAKAVFGIDVSAR
jgi:RNA polymerase sigma factor (sigma-70 family)